MTINDEDINDFLAHYGVKGMKWGIRNEPKRGSRREARKEVRSVGKAARASIKAHRKASSDAERKAAREKYREEVLKKVQTKDFKDKYIRANTAGKGEIAARTILSGPLAPLTYAALKQHNRGVQSANSLNIAVAKEVFKEMNATRPISPIGATRAGARNLKEKK